MIISFKEVGHFPAISPETNPTHHQEDNLIVDCELETQNMNQSISQAGDVIDIMANMSGGKEYTIAH